MYIENAASKRRSLKHLLKVKLVFRSSSYSKYSGGLKNSSYDESYEDDYSNSFSYSGSKNYSSSSSTGSRMALASLK